MANREETAAMVTIALSNFHSTKGLQCNCVLTRYFWQENSALCACYLVKMCARMSTLSASAAQAHFPCDAATSATSYLHSWHFICGGYSLKRFISPIILREYLLTIYILYTKTYLSCASQFGARKISVKQGEILKWVVLYGLSASFSLCWCIHYRLA